MSRETQEEVPPAGPEAPPVGRPGARRGAGQRRSVSVSAHGPPPEPDEGGACCRRLPSLQSGVVSHLAGTYVFYL